ncbi:ATP-binding protein [Sphaerisporangium album]|uniref:ATP-binding protein n=1 Tax=Sphaerisporangium album TaxID=509200 RepID=UPI0015F098FE|nr:tetratricopeptide repeat protein [Sphaerisporangium album]
MRINVGARQETPPPAQLAHAPAVFIGRHAELARLDGFLEGQEHSPDSPALVVIAGLGGVGKSSLALKWLHGIRHHYGDGQLYADLRASAPDSPVSPGEVLERFLRALGIAPQYVPAVLDEQATLFRSATAGRRLIIMLDDAFSAAQVRAVLPASGGSLVVVTTRRRLSGLVVDGARVLDLDPLSHDDALGLLGRMVGTERTHAEPEEARELVTLCGRLPIAVCASAARLALRPRWPIRRLVGELSGATRRLSLMSADDDISPQAAFDVSYGSLGDDEARLYRMLGLHPGADFGSGVAAAAGDIDQPEAFRLLDELAGASLVQEEGDDRFRLHELLRLHAHAKAEDIDTDEERRAAFTRIAHWYLRAAVAADRVVLPGRWHVGPLYAQAPPSYVTFEEPAQALDWLESELPNLRAVVVGAHERKLHDLAWWTCESLWAVFLNRKHYSTWVETHELGLASARESEDPRAVPRMLLALATAYLNLQEFRRAAEMCRQAAALAHASGHDLGEASALDSLGVAHLGMGEPEEAMARFEQALAIHRRIGQSRGVALLTRRMGEASRDLGRYDEAVRWFLDAYSLFGALSERYNQTRVLSGLGRTHLLAGRPADAVESLTEALSLAEAIGARYEQADIGSSLAEALARTGDRAGALGRLARAAEIFTELGAPRREDVLRRLDELAGGGPRRA